MLEIRKTQNTHGQAYYVVEVAANGAIIATGATPPQAWDNAQQKLSEALRRLSREAVEPWQEQNWPEA